MPAMSRKEDLMSKYNLYIEDVSVEAVFNKLGGVEGARRLLRGELEVKAKDLPSTIFPLFVNYGMSIEDAVKLGRYDWAHDGITSKNFPTKRVGTANVVVELVHFNRSISTEDALREFDRMGYRPAELHEGLALGEAHPDLQREFSIVILGSVWQNHWNGSRVVPCLSRHGSKRSLSLGWIEYGWNESYRFAIVRKPA